MELGTRCREGTWSCDVIVAGCQRRNSTLAADGVTVLGYFKNQLCLVPPGFRSSPTRAGQESFACDGK